MHLCIDMQNLFGPASPWHVPWVEAILPNIVDICSRRSEDTVFTRFIPPKSPEAAMGAWKSYYRKWEALTLERVDPCSTRLYILPGQKAFSSDICTKGVFTH